MNSDSAAGGKTLKDEVRAFSGARHMKLDGEGRPYITLAQFIKLEGLVDSGGEAKPRVRFGGVLVNGVEDLRPGRKLHAGDRVLVDGSERIVDIATAAENPPT